MYVRFKFHVKPMSRQTVSLSMSFGLMITCAGINKDSLSHLIRQLITYIDFNLWCRTCL